MLSAIATLLKNCCRDKAIPIRAWLAMFLLGVGTIASGVDVFLLPVAPVGKETGTVPATMKLVRTSSIGGLQVRLSLNGNSTAQLNTDYTVSGVDDPSFATPDPSDPITDPQTSTVTFLDGESEHLISITPSDDLLVEARESAVFTIKPINLSYVIGAPSSMSATIADNDHKARIQVPDPIADEDSALFGLVSDSDIQRRAVMRVRFDPFVPGTEYTRNLAVQFIATGGTRPIAELNADYEVHYKICGNDRGVTDERSRIGYDKVNILGTGLGYNIIAHLAGENQIDIAGDSAGISAGSTIRFNNHSQVYPVLSSGNNGIVLGSLVTRTGTVSVTLGSATITGANSLFLSELARGESIVVNGETMQIEDIDTNTSLTVTSPFSAAQTNVALRSEVPFPLVANVPNGTTINVLSGGTSGTEVTITVDHVYPVGSSSIKVDFGSGGLFEGDVFQIEGHDGFYVVTQDTRSLVPAAEAAGTGTLTVVLAAPRRITGVGTTFTEDLAVGDFVSVNGQVRRVIAIASDTSATVNSVFNTAATGAAYTIQRPGTSGVVEFRRYQGAGSGSGLEADTSGSPLVTTLIAATVSGGVMQVLVPEESTKVEISVSPTINGDGEEGAEEVRMRMIADEDYELITPQESSVIIADRDVTTSISVVSNAGLPSQTGFFQITLSQSFSRSITVPYQVVDNLPTLAGPGNDYDETILPSVTFIAGQTQALIQVDPIVSRGPASVTLTLTPTFDYKLSGSTSSGVNPSATMDISNSIGSVSITATIPVASESAVTPVNGQFTPRIVRNAGQNGAVSITLKVAGTAELGSRYEFVNPSNGLITATNNQIQVVIPSGNDTTTVGVRPINNFLADGDQIVQLQVVDGQSYLVGAPSTASVSIDDDEPTVSVTFVNDAARPSTPGAFLFSYSGTSLSQAIVVNFTYSGSAVRDTDFTAATSVTIPAGNTSQTLSINPIDTPSGNAATVAVTIMSSMTYNIGNSSASLQILASNAPQGNKPTPGSINSGSSSGGCGLGSGFATLVGLGMFALLAFRRRQD